MECRWPGGGGLHEAEGSHAGELRGVQLYGAGPGEGDRCGLWRYMCSAHFCMIEVVVVGRRRRSREEEEEYCTSAASVKSARNRQVPQHTAGPHETYARRRAPPRARRRTYPDHWFHTASSLIASVSHARACVGIRDYLCSKSTDFKAIYELPPVPSPVESRRER